MKTRRLAPIMVALALVAVSCSSGDDDAPAATEAPAAADAVGDGDAGGLTLTSSGAGLGDIVTGPGGLTVYIFTPDSASAPTCYDDCAASWPAVPAQAGVGDGLEASLLGSVDRTDGITQATYGGWPLYTFAGDAGPGDTNGQGVGTVWFVIGADGNGISSF